jgi:ankyrin repeat protein
MEVGNASNIEDLVGSLETREQKISFIDSLYDNPIITSENLVDVYQSNFGLDDDEIFNTEDLKRIIDHPLFDVNIQYSVYNNTPLFIATEYFNYTIIEYLLQKGAYINYINSKGHNLLIYTLEEIIFNEDLGDTEHILRLFEMCKWLIRHGVKFNYKWRDFTIDPVFNEINISALRYLRVINKYDKYDKNDKFIHYIRDRRNASIPGGGKRSKLKTKRNKH